MCTRICVTDVQFQIALKHAQYMYMYMYYVPMQYAQWA